MTTAEPLEGSATAEEYNCQRLGVHNNHKRYVVLNLEDVEIRGVQIAGSNVSSWLQADIQSPKIDFRCTPESGHSEAHAGLPVLTQRRPSRLPQTGDAKTLLEFSSVRIITRHQPLVDSSEHEVWREEAGAG